MKAQEFRKHFDPAFYDGIVDSLSIDYRQEEVEEMLQDADIEMLYGKITVTYANGVIDIFKVDWIPHISHERNSLQS